MVPADIAARVDRLIGGTHRTDDLIHIFAWMRFNTAGRAPFVRDIGDFIAHRHEREQGFTWRIALDFYSRALLAGFNGQAQPITREVFATGCRSSLRLIGPTDVKKRTGFSYKTAEHRLSSALDKLVDIVDGTAVFSESRTDQESSILRLCSDLFRWPSAITQFQFVSQFIQCLQAHGKTIALDDHGRNHLGDFMSKFVVTLIHGSQIMSESGAPICKLELGQSDEKLTIAVDFPIGHGAIVANLYQSELPFPDALSPRLRQVDAALDLALEIDDNGLIDFIG